MNFKREFNKDYIFYLLGTFGKIMKCHIYTRDKIPKIKNKKLLNEDIDKYVFVEFDTLEQAGNAKKFLEELKFKKLNYNLNSYYTKKNNIKINFIDKFNYDLNFKIGKNIAKDNSPYFKFDFNIDLLDFNFCKQIENDDYCLYLINKNPIELEKLFDIININKKINRLESNKNYSKILIYFNNKTDLEIFFNFFEKNNIYNDFQVINPLVYNNIFHNFFLYENKFDKLLKSFFNKILFFKEKKLILSSLEKILEKNKNEIFFPKLKKSPTSYYLLLKINNINLFFIEFLKTEKFKFIHKIFKHLNLFLKINNDSEYLIVFNNLKLTILFLKHFHNQKYYEKNILINFISGKNLDLNIRNMISNKNLNLENYILEKINILDLNDYFIENSTSNIIKDKEKDYFSRKIEEI